MTDVVNVEWPALNAVAFFPPQQCIRCGELTPWVDWSFESRLCPMKCGRAMWAEFDQANSEAGDWQFQ